MTMDDIRTLVRLSRRGGRTREQEMQAALDNPAPTPRRQAAPASAGPRAPSADGARRTGQAASTQRGGASRAQARGISTPQAPASARTGRPNSAAAATAKGGTGRLRDDLKDPLKLYKEKLEHISQMEGDLDFREKPYFRTALWEATWRNHDEIVRLLVEKRASVCIPDTQNRTPLHEAAYYGHEKLVEFLLERGHPLNPRDCFGQTPLFRAVDGGRHDVVALLVQNRADTSLLDNDSVTARHVSAFQGMPKMATWLLYNGAHKNRCAFDDLPRHNLLAGSQSISASQSIADAAKTGALGEVATTGPSPGLSADGSAQGQSQALPDLTIRADQRRTLAAVQGGPSHTAQRLSSTSESASIETGSTQPPKPRATVRTAPRGNNPGW